MTLNDFFNLFGFAPKKRGVQPVILVNDSGNTYEAGSGGGGGGGTVTVTGAVEIANDSGSPIPVSGTVTVANPTANPETGLAKDNTITTNLGVRADTPATTDTGSFSLIALFKNLLQKATTLISNTNDISTINGRVNNLVFGIGDINTDFNAAPSDTDAFASMRALTKRLLVKLNAGGTTLLNSIGFSLPQKDSVTGTLFTGATGIQPNLLVGGTLNGVGVTSFTDVRNYASGKIIIVSASTTGSYTFQGAFNDTFTIGVQTIQVIEDTAQNLNPINAAITNTTSTRIFLVDLNGVNFFRINLSTQSSGGNLQAFGIFSQFPLAPKNYNIQQATAANLAVTANIASGQTLATVTAVTTVANANLQGSTANGASTYQTAISAATNNLTQVKSGATLLNSLVAHNNTATVRYLKIFNLLSASVTMGTTSPSLNIPLPPNALTQINLGPYGVRFSTGFTYAITAGQALLDNTAVAAGDVVINSTYY